MKRMTAIILGTLLGTLFQACSTEPITETGTQSSFDFYASANTCVLSQEKENERVLELTWSASGDNESTEYRLEISTGLDGASVYVENFPGNGAHYRRFSVKELNHIIIDRCKAIACGDTYNQILGQRTDIRLKIKLTRSTSIHWRLQSSADSLYVDCTPYIPVYPDHNHKAPLYWSPYEYNFLTNHYIPEDEWQTNIDWVAENLLDYGYTMVSTDGWMDETNAYNEYGYLDRHSLTWQHDYGWWADYLADKGMQLGVYCNPLWVPSGAASAGIKIKGTDIPIENIINRTEENGGYHNYLWVQMDRPGAEEWVRGYVAHFGQMGVKFLRVDFLSWYEDGYDIGYGTVGPDRPDWMYPTALRWMREECDKYGMILSLVMPHLYNDGAVEQNYGHMARISNDTAEGSWYHFSEVERGVHRKGWSQYSNVFDGMIYFSRISGRGKIMLDGDFIRLNTMASEDECRSVISLNIIAGGPVTVSDQYNTIGERIEFYRNRELLELVRDGFVGKPLSDHPPVSETEDNRQSDIWTGEMSNGDMILAVFNRPWNGKQETMEYTFSPADFGMDDNCTIRDLWQHKNLEHQQSYSFTIPANGCIVLRITQ